MERTLGINKSPEAEKGPEQAEGRVEKPRRPPLKYIVTHLRPHLDELAAIALINLYGQRKWWWPLSAPPDVRFEPSYESALAFFAEEKIPLDRVVFVGIGHDEFDEHKVEGRLPDTCSADLVARALGINRWRNVKKLLREVRLSDITATQGMLGLGNVLKVIQAYRKVDSESLGLCLDFVHATVEALLKQGDEFHRECQMEFESNGKMIVVNGVRIALVQTELETMHKWLRSMRQADITIQCHADGHANIFSGQKCRALMPEIAFRIGCRENLMMYSVRPNEDDAAAYATYNALCEIRALGKDVELTGLARHWYYHAKAGALHNGSSTHTDKPATTLTLEELEHVVSCVANDVAPAEVAQNMMEVTQDAIDHFLEEDPL